MIKLINISKKYGKREIIKNFSVDLPDTGLVLFQGANGSGKTTLLKIITNNIKFSGDIIFSDDLKHEDIYFLASEEELFINLSVIEKAKLLLNDDELIKFKNFLETYDLEYLTNYKIKNLSSGEKQKIELFILLSRKSKVSILDEPLEYIDKETKPLIISELKKLSKESLVIITSPKDYIDYDLLLLFYKNEIKVISDTSKFNKCVLDNKSHHIKFKDWFKIFFSRNSILPVCISVFLSIFVFIISICINLFAITSTKQLKSVLKDDPGIYFTYDKENNKNHRVENIYQASDNPNNLVNSILTASAYSRSYNEDGTLSQFNNYRKFKPDYILESENIYINGKNTKINDYEVYLSDYAFDLLYSDSIIDSLFPSDVAKEEDQLGIKFEFNGFKQFTLTAKKYKTDYKNYYPTIDKNIDHNGYINEKEIFIQRANEFYNYAIVNSKTFDLFFNRFDQSKKEELFQSLLNYENENIESNLEKYTPSNTFLYYYDSVLVNLGFADETNFLESGYVFFNYKFAKNKLNMTYEEFQELSKTRDQTNEYNTISFEINGYKFENMKFNPLPVYITGNNNELYLSYDDALKLKNSVEIKEDLKKYYNYEVEILNDNYEKMIVSKDFIFSDLYFNLYNNKQFMNHSLKIVIYSMSVSVVMLVFLYSILYLRKESKMKKTLYNKGYKNSEIILSIYFIRLTLLLFLVSIAIILSVFLTTSLALYFKILH